MPGKKQREAFRVAKISRASRCNDSKESFGKSCLPTVFCGREKKNPRMGIRGRSRASEIGAADLRKGISRGVCRCCAAGVDCRNLSTARVRPHRDGSATFRTGWRCGRRVSSEDSAGIRGVPAAAKKSWCKSAAAMGAHVTPVFFRLQTFFSQVDERLDEWIGGSAVVRRANDACAQTKTGGRSRPRIASQWNIGSLSVTSAAVPCRSRGSRRCSDTRWRW